MEARFSSPVQTCPGAHPASYTMGTGSFPGVKRPGCGVNHQLSSSTEVKERVKLYLYSPSVPLWQVIGGTLPYSLKNAQTRSGDHPVTYSTCTRMKLTAHFNLAPREEIFGAVPPLPHTLHGVMLKYVQEKFNLPGNAQQRLHAAESILIIWQLLSKSPAILYFTTAVFLNRRAAARYRALASIILGRERFSWNW